MGAFGVKELIVETDIHCATAPGAKKSTGTLGLSPRTKKAET